jgi:hypothetical protein
MVCAWAVSKVEARMREIYTAHRPQKLADVVGLLLEWRDEEEELLALVTQKYMGSATAGQTVMLARTMSP